MDNSLSAPDDECSEETVLCRCKSQVSGQIASGAGIGHRSFGNHLLCRFALDAMLLFSVLALLLIPLASCELEGGYREVKADELKKLIDSGVPILVVDNRSEYEYSRGHLPKAINIPQERLFSLDNLLPKDKAFPIVFYCTGYG
jgi:hypothetical protein